MEWSSPRTPSIQRAQPGQTNECLMCGPAHGGQSDHIDVNSKMYSQRQQKRVLTRRKCFERSHSSIVWNNRVKTPTNSAHSCRRPAKPSPPVLLRPERAGVVVAAPCPVAHVPASPPPPARVLTAVPEEEALSPAAGLVVDVSVSGTHRPRSTSAAEARHSSKKARMMD